MKVTNLISYKLLTLLTLTKLTPLTPLTPLTLTKLTPLTPLTPLTLTKLTLLTLTQLAALTLIGCANRGVGPQGGPKDTIPPVVVKEEPVHGTLRYHDKSQQVVLTMDEYVQLNDVQKHILISPPQQRPPEVKVVGKKVIMAFEEPFKDSTTYTIQFGEAICDYHERVPMKGYSLSFSTGDWIDSLEVCGRLVNAANLNPISGILVGIQRDVHDSALATVPFTRVGRTDEQGRFCIHNIAAGAYRLYALEDISRDYVYQPGEGLAFYDALVTPVAGDSAEYVLWYFKEDKQRVYFQRCYREQAYCVRLQFSAPMDVQPVVRSLPPSVLDSTRSDSAWVDWLSYASVQYSAHNDTVQIWLTDSAAIRQDTLVMALTYYKSDSLYRLVAQTDTLRAIYRAPRLTDKMRERMAREAREAKLDIKSNARLSYDIYQPLVLRFATPVDSLWRERITLWHKVDTVFRPMSYTLLPNDSAQMSYRIDPAWQAEQTYELRLDSGAFKDVYGRVNKATKFTWKIKSLQEYATLTIRMTHWNASMRLQLLDEKDNVLRDVPALEQGTLLEYLAPKSFYLRMYEDRNGDGRWTTGDWGLKRQPEPVYYFPAKLTLRANWDFEEEFDHLKVSQLEAKPKELVKDAAGK